MSDDQALDYVALAAEVRGPRGELDVTRLQDLLTDAWAAAYRAGTGPCQLLEFHEAGATFLFDSAEDSESERASRSVAAYARSHRTPRQRDQYFQRGYPSPTGRASRPLDKGHMIPHAAGGQFGPNIFPQDAALNRGWSLEGRRYRAMEERAVQVSGSFFFCRLVYVDDTDFPADVELGLVSEHELIVERYRNRFDQASPTGADADELASVRRVLATAAPRQVGDLGGETVVAHLETVLDATIVAVGNAGPPRSQGRQDLGVVAVLGEDLVAFEANTRYFGRSAGRLTSTGDLPRPRLPRPARGRQYGLPSSRQGSQDHTTPRLADHIDVGGDYAGAKLRAVVVDLRSMLVQQFRVDDDGRVTGTVGEPADCSSAAVTALERIVTHRGAL